MEHEDNQQERPLLAWLAGIADGEGSFYCSKHVRKEGTFFYPCFCIINTDLGLLDRVCGILKDNSIGFYIQPHRIHGAVKAYTVRVNGMKRLQKLIPLLLPYLGGYKKQQAERILDYIQWRLSQPLHNFDKRRSEELKATLTAENTRGILRDYTPAHFHLVEDIVPSA